MDLLTPLLQTAAGSSLSEESLGRIRTALPAMKDRGSTLPELAEAFRFFWTANVDDLNKKARKAYLAAQAAGE